MKPFRISNIHLDEDHYVSGITVVLDAPYLPALNEALGLPGGHPRLAERSERGGTELWFNLTTTELLDLFRTAGSWTGEDRKIPGAYDALTLVVYGLMED